MPLIIPDFHDEPTFRSFSTLEAEVAALGSWSALSSFVVSGFLVQRSTDNSLFYVQKYIGEKTVPADVRRLRRSVSEVMRRMGQPVIVKHMFNDHDYRLGIAKPSPAAPPSAYGNQARNRDTFSYGTGYCSMELSPNEWIDPSSGAIEVADSAPGLGFIQAPFYRGYGPGFLTYLIEPDVALDLFKLTSTGTMIKTQSQTVVASWFPEINDNDLIINVELDKDGNVVDTHERYQAKRTSPVSIRGLDQRGRREAAAEHGNRHVVNQAFEMNAVLETSVLMGVETDR